MSEKAAWLNHLKATGQKLPPFFRGNVIVAADGQRYKYEPEEMYVAWTEADTGKFVDYCWPPLYRNKALRALVYVWASIKSLPGKLFTPTCHQKTA
jgi:hypothetical protein